MCGIVTFAQMVIVIGVQLHLELLVRFHQRIDILHGMLNVHIVISCTVDDEHVACQVFGTRQQRSLLIPEGIHLRTPHVPLSVSGVVQTPVCDRRDSYTCLERMIRLTHGEQRLITAVTPPQKGYSRCVYVVSCAHKLRRSDQVFRLFDTRFI